MCLWGGFWWLALASGDWESRPTSWVWVGISRPSEGLDRTKRLSKRGFAASSSACHWAGTSVIFCLWTWNQTRTYVISSPDSQTFRLGLGLTLLVAHQGLACRSTAIIGLCNPGSNDSFCLEFISNKQAHTHTHIHTTYLYLYHWWYSNWYLVYQFVYRFYIVYPALNFDINREKIWQKSQTLSTSGKTGNI